MIEGKAPIVGSFKPYLEGQADFVSSLEKSEIPDLFWL